MTAREVVHQAIDDLTETEAETLLEIYTDRRKREDPGLALRYAFVEVYRARDNDAGLRTEGD
jgi:hypothetical protein